MTFADRILARVFMIIPIGAIVLSFASATTGEDAMGRIMFYLLFPGTVFFFGSIFVLRIIDRMRAALPRRRRIHKPLVSNPFPCISPALWAKGMGAIIVIAIARGVVSAILSGSVDSLLYPALPAAVAGAVFLVFISRKRNGFTRGMELRAKGKYQAAREALLSFERERPDDPTAVDGAIFIHLLFNDELEAVAAAQHAVDTRSKYLPLFRRGQALGRVGALDEALADFMEEYTIRTLPTIPVYMSRVLIDQRRLGSALHYLEKEAWAVNGPAGLLFLGDAYRLLGMTEEAVATYKDAVSVSKRMLPGTLSDLAFAQAQLGEFDNAERSAREWLEQLPRDLLAHTTLMIVCVARGKNEEALEIARALASISPHAAIRALEDPELSSLMADQRFRGLYVSCGQRRREVVHEALRIVEGMRLTA